MLTLLLELIAQTITAPPDMSIGILANKYTVSIHHEEEIVIFPLLHGVGFLIDKTRKRYHHLHNHLGEG